MVDKPQAQATDAKPVDGASPVVPPRRPPGHRSTDARDTVAEMAARAQEISMEAGSKIAAAMKDVINAAAGLTGFAIESARDVVQYMVRRGQMTQDEADRVIRDAEDANSGRKPSAGGRSDLRAERSASGGRPEMRIGVPSSPPPRPATPSAGQPAMVAPAAKSTAKKAVAKAPAKSAKRASRPTARTKSARARSAGKRGAAKKKR